MFLARETIKTLVKNRAANHYRLIAFLKMNSNDCKTMTKRSSCLLHHVHGNNFSCVPHVVRVTVVIMPVIIITVEVVTTRMKITTLRLHLFQPHNDPHAVRRRVRVTPTTPFSLGYQRL